MGDLAGWHERLKEENHRVSLRNVRVLCVLAVTLVPACFVLDYFAYPDKKWVFLKGRLVASVVEMILMAISYSSWGKRHVRSLVLAVPMGCVAVIAWMIYMSGDPASPYYAGLTLCLVGVGFFFQWSYLESIVAVALTFACYLAATLPHLTMDHWKSATAGTFANNGVFLILHSIIIITGSVVHQRVRTNEVVSRFKLADSRKELQESNLRLVEADRLKTDFFSNVTHELRTPLTLMLAPLQRLQRLYPAASATNGKNHFAGLNQELGGIYQNGLRLLKLINDLLDLSGADSQKPQVTYHRFELSNFTTRLLRPLATMAQQGNVTVMYEDHSLITTVDADEEKLEKIMLNLLFNAVKFTPSGGTVTLVIRRDDEMILLEVIDTGTGIPSHSLPYIFDRFWQADTSVTRRHPGTGLGLALVKELVEGMGGSVRAESTLNVGTTMRVRLPLRMVGEVAIWGQSKEGMEEAQTPLLPFQPAPGTDKTAASSADWIRSIYREAEAIQASSESGRTSPNVGLATTFTEEERAKLPRVLIVDDEPGMLGFLRKELEPHYQIIEATEGRTALKLALELLPDLVVADYMMPELDGLSLCKALREDTSTRLLPVMLVTARSDEEVRVTALDNGANDVLVKPFSLTEFHSRIHNLVQSCLLQREVTSRNSELEKTLAELRAAERELVQSEKMAALGILTGGIMHEINNPLNFARSALYMLDRRASKLPTETARDVGEIVDDLREGINRISTIVADLRTFCHPDTVVVSTCTVAEPVSSAIRLLAPALKASQVTVHEDLSAEVHVRGDRNQLTLVFLNLIKNAVDAMSAVGSPESEGKEVWVSTQCKEDGKVDVLFRDNGPGILPENQPKVFDPFFTTKPSGEGTGLGLSMCYRIITAHGGSITVGSAPQGGAEFRVRLDAGSVSSETILVHNPALSA